ncbi:uncharacterized protein METZ01_LOCUS234907, partial [marine metagenome]
MTRSSPNVDILEDSSHKLNFFMPATPLAFFWCLFLSSLRNPRT